MPLFHFHLRLSDRLEWDEVGVTFASLEAAYLDVCDSLPAMAGELVGDGHDLSRCIFIIAAPADQTLMEVGFREFQRLPARSGAAHKAEQRAAVAAHLHRAKEVAAQARQISTEARESLVRSRAAMIDLRHRRAERENG